MGEKSERREDLDFKRRDLMVGAGTVVAASAVPGAAGAATTAGATPGGVIGEGLTVYRTTPFLTAANSSYTTAAMKNVVVPAINAASTDATYIQHINWGDYQKIMAIQQNWPQAAQAAWATESGNARTALSNQTVSVTLPNGTSVTLRKVDLLDAAVRTCLNSNPPISINVDVKPTTDPQNRHDIGLSWGTGPDNLAQLNLTMYCPSGS